MNFEKLVAHLVAEGEKTRDLMRAAMQATDRGRRLQGARVLPLPTQALAGTPGTVLWSGAGRLMGWTLRNATGTGTLVVNFYDGNDNAGQLVATAGAVTSGPPAWFGASGLSVTEKLAVEVIATGGAVLAGVAYYGATD